MQDIKIQGDGFKLKLMQERDKKEISLWAQQLLQRQQGKFVERRMSSEKSFSQTAGSQCGRRRPEEHRLHLFPLIPLRKGSFDPLLPSQGNREGGHAAHSLQPCCWDRKLLCSCWDLQPWPL